jgi:hypothetical protein
MPYILPPGQTFEPGDVFAEIAFPNLRAPVRYYRRRKDPSTREQKANATQPEYYQLPDNVSAKDGDIIHTSFQRRTVMVLSHGCEMEKVLSRGANPDRRHWSVAPVDRIPAPTDELEQRRVDRIRAGNQPNRFYVPENDFLRPGDYAVDLRRITPLPASCFLDAQKICSLSETARDDLYAQIGVNFSGWAFYLAPVPCPNCGHEFDPREFLVSSGDDPDEDY